MLKKLKYYVDIIGERTGVYLFLGILGLFLTYFTISDINHEILLRSNKSKGTYGIVTNKELISNSGTLSINYTINYLNNYTYFLTSECFDCNINVGDSIALTYYIDKPFIVKYSGNETISILNSIWLKSFINLILLLFLLKGILRVFNGKYEK